MSVIGDIWHPIPDALGYEISATGQVRSVDRCQDGRSLRGVQLKPSPLGNGYLGVKITTDSGRRTVRIHRLVCLVFHGEPPTPKHEGRHLNGIKTDNRAENLAWGTKSENALDAVRHGQNANARKTHCPKGHEYITQRLTDDRTRRRCAECVRRPRRVRLPKLCSITGCERKNHSRGWCSIHYKHWWIFGDPTAGIFGRGGDRRKSA